jgi:hypothetical protein
MVLILKPDGGDVPFALSGGASDVLFARGPLLPQAARNPLPKSARTSPPSARSLTRRSMPPYVAIATPRARASTVKLTHDRLIRFRLPPDGEECLAFTDDRLPLRLRLSRVVGICHAVMNHISPRPASTEPASRLRGLGADRRSPRLAVRRPRGNPANAAEGLGSFVPAIRSG